MEQEFPYNHRKLVSHILQILDTKLTTSALSADQIKGLKMGMQCLQTAYGLGEPDFRPNSFLGILSTLFLVHADVTKDVPRRPLSSIYNFLAEAMCVNTGQMYIKPAEATDSNKESAEELHNRGFNAITRLDHLEASVWYTWAITIDGNNPLYFCNRAAVYIKLERLEDAIRDCQIALQLQPSCALAYGRMGVAFALQRKNIDGILCFWLCLELWTGDLDSKYDACQSNLQASLEIILEDIPTAQTQALRSPTLEILFRNRNLVNILSKMFQQPIMLAFWARLAGYFAVGGFGAGTAQGTPGRLTKFKLICANIYAGLRNLEPDWSLTVWLDW